MLVMNLICLRIGIHCVPRSRPESRMSERDTFRIASLYDVPVEGLGPLAGQSVGNLLDVLVSSSGQAL